MQSCSTATRSANPPSARLRPREFRPKKDFQLGVVRILFGAGRRDPIGARGAFSVCPFLTIVAGTTALSSPLGQSGGPAALVPHGRRGEGPLGVPDVLRGADRSRAELLRLVARRSALRLATLRRSGRRQRKQQQQESPPLLRARLAPRAPAAPDACAGLEICAPPHPPPCPP